MKQKCAFWLRYGEIIFCNMSSFHGENLVYAGVYNLYETDMWAPHQFHIGLIQLGV